MVTDRELLERIYALLQEMAGHEIALEVERRAARKQAHDAWLANPLLDHMGMRLFNALCQAGITPAQAREMDTGALMRVRGIGRKSAGWLKDNL